MAINSANYSISRIITVQINAKNPLIFNSIESFLFLWYPRMTNVLSFEQDSLCEYYEHNAFLLYKSFSQRYQCINCLSFQLMEQYSVISRDIK